MDFLTFAWAKPYEIVLQFFDKIFRIPQQISHPRIPILGAPLEAEKSYEWKTGQNWFYGGSNYVGYGEVKKVPLILYTKLTSVKRE